jgi:hypothetical protein
MTDRTSYRTRNLTSVVFLLKDAGDGRTPLRGQDGKVIRDYAGMKFLKISGNENHQRRRVIPLNAMEFFTQQAKELAAASGVEWAQLDKAEVDAVVQDLIGQYADLFGRPNGKGGEPVTYLPRKEDGTPDIEEFSLVVPKTLCEDGGSLQVGAKLKMPSSGPTAASAGVASIFDRIKAQRAAAEAAKNATEAKPEAPTAPVS